MPQKNSDLKWRKLPEHKSLKGRAGHTTTLVGRQLFVLGGRNGNVFFNDVWAFDVELEQWKQLEPKAPFAPRAYHTTTLIGDQELWMIGGSDQYTVFDDIHVLNTVTLQWSSPIISGSGTLRRRGTHAAVLHPVQSRAILIHGGYGGSDPQWLGDLSLLCTDSLEWHELNPSGAVPHARGYHSLTTVGAYAVLYGGKGDAGIVKEDCLSVYNCAANVWVNPNVEGNAPLPRSNHAATLMDVNFIIIHGGRHGALRLSDMFVLQVFQPPMSSMSTLNLKWHIVEKAKSPVKARKSLGKRANLTAEADSPHGRSAHSLIAKDHTLYLFGGYGGHGLTFSDIFVLRNFPGLQELVQQDKLDPTSNYDQTPIMVADDSDEENTKGWRSTKRPKQQIYGDPKSIPRLQEVGQALIQAFDTSTFRNQDAVNNTKIQSPKLVDETRQPSRRQVQGVSNMENNALVMMAREKDAFQNEVKSLQKIIDSLKQDLKEKTCTVAELHTDKVRLQQELDSLDEKRSDLKNVIEVLEKKVQLMSQKIKNSEAQNENLKDQIQVLKASLEEKERQSYEVAQEAKDAHHKCEELAGSLDNVRSFCSEVVRERDECKSCVEKLQSELEMQMQTLQQLNLKFENEKTFLLNEVAERKATADRLLTELGTSKECARALQDTVGAKTKQLEAVKSKADLLQKEKEELGQSNAVLIAENRQLLAARDAANANFDFIKSELTSTRALYERSTVEVIRLKEKVEQSREHIASLHESLKMTEENMKIEHQETERLRALLNEVEQFEQVQMAALQQHLEKVKCARQSCPL